MNIVTQQDIFFAGKTQAWMVFEALRSRVLEIWPQTQLRVMKTCIAFDDPKPFAYVSFPPKKELSGLWLSISLREMIQSPRFSMVVPVAKSRYTVHIHLPDKEAIDDELFDWIARSHR